MTSGAARRVLPVGRRLKDDDAGAFLVLEAILVALLVLTAILFFTSIQRPSTGQAGSGGLDLAQVSADTLQVLQVRQFNGQTMNDWVTNVTRGDSSTTTAVDQFIRQVLPTGSRYSLRLDNGIASPALQILPATSVDTPRGARGSEIMFMPRWTSYRNDTIDVTLSPGDVIDSTAGLAYDLVKTTTTGTYYQCYRSPSSYETVNDVDTTDNLWASHWRATPGGVVTWKSNVGASAQQVPTDLPFGRWRAYTAAACTGTPKVVNVVPPGGRTVSVTTTGTTTINFVAGTLGSSDVGRTVTGAGIPAAARLATVGASSGTLTAAATTSTATTVTISPDTTFQPYGLQLVVWFGA